MTDPSARILLFHRDYHGLTGGHLKVSHYFGHARHSKKFQPRIYFTPESIRGPDNPWHGITPAPLEFWQPLEAAALFVAGVDWSVVPNPSPRPVLNLIQGVQHAKPGDPRRSFLARPAVRICVSQEVADVIAATGLVNGPIHIIPNGIDLAEISATHERDICVLIAGLKRPDFATAVAQQLADRGVRAQVIDRLLPRPVFLNRLARARVAVTLPCVEEGFYLPALEAMAAGATVVCPDCIGNRGFCRDRQTAFVPDYSVEAVVLATLAALHQSPQAVASMRAAAAAQVRNHHLDAERRAFLEILDAMG